MRNHYVPEPAPDMEAHLADRIDALASALPRCGLTEIVRGVDDIRCLARDNGYPAVEILASHLESAVAADGRGAAIRTYFAAMQDAAHAPRGPLPAGVADAWLASVAVRLTC
ncbi:hypothetical protein [Sphingopyxis sp. MWB1]|uniref:hypothetical protein n=1 Tax=Sphingopyxis sp. MWB1 TaxID=1537715 RepID=UPI00051A5C1C|nr:hypothetical protein [Sphingopyxis sp. MWB1]